MWRDSIAKFGDSIAKNVGILVIQDSCGSNDII
jgi:hypothetical protein